MNKLWICGILICTTAAAGNLPNPRLTPGAASPALTRGILCSSKFRTGSIRNVSAVTKRQAYARYGIKPCPGCYEVDHLISLEIGGSNDIKNLWPQSYVTKPWNAHVKDTLENKLHRMVCARTISLASAQHQIRTNWIAAWKRYVNGRVGK